MTDRNAFSDRLDDILQLYGLALSVGSSLDLNASCDRFIRMLMARKNLTFAGVWLRSEAVGRGPEGTLELVYAHPAYRAAQHRIGAADPMLARLTATGAFSVTAGEPGFRELATEREVDGGTYAAFALGNIGVLKLLSASRSAPFQADELQQLGTVLSKFAVSLEACLFHERLVNEMGERSRAEAELRRLSDQRKWLLDVSQKLLRARRLDDLIGTLTSAIRAVLPFDRCGVHWLDHDELFDPLARPTWDDVTGVGVRLEAPLLVEGQPVGVFVIERDASQPFTEEEDEVVELLVSHAAAAVQNARLNERLQLSEQRYRTLFEESRDIVFISSPDGRYVDINPVAADIFGYDRREDLLEVDIGRDLFVDLAERERYLADLERRGSVQDYELRMRRRDGQEVIILETSVAVRDDRGRIVAHRGFMRDVTRTRELERQLHQAQKLESIGLLAGGIAHDFNNLLGGILGYASLLRERAGLDERTARYVRTIEQSARRARDLTAQLLAFARSGHSQKQPVDLNGVVIETMTLLEQTLEDGIAVDCDLAEDIGVIAADRSQMLQVVMNLAVNSRDAMPDGGRLRVRTRRTLAPRGGLVDSTPTPHVLLEVRDTGHGMDASTQERVFEPFFTTKGPGGGTGLGLSLVYGVVKTHTGHVRLQSRPGDGTCVQVYLPAEVATDPLPEAEAGDAPCGQGELILVVDDEEVIRDLAGDVLRSNGYEVLTAPGGAEALRLFRDHGDRVGLVLLDMVMPEMGGLDVLSALRVLDPDVRVILSSGYTQVAGPDRLDRPGVRGFLQKPYDMSRLLSTVRSVLDSGD